MQTLALCIMKILCSISFRHHGDCFLNTRARYVGGLTDMVDGTIARKTNTDSKFGARRDSVADFIFVVAALSKLLPAMDIPQWLWIWVTADDLSMNICS